MGGVRMLTRVRLRRRWRTVLLVAVLIAVAGGVVLTGIAGARRTRSALDRLSHQTRAADAGILLFDGPDPAFTARVARLPGVRSLAASEVWAASLVDPSTREETPIVAAIDDRLGTTTDRTILVAGRRARTADEIVLPSNVADRRGFPVGSNVRIATFADAQLDALRSGQSVAPGGPTLHLRVVGIDRSVRDLTTQGEKTGIVFLDSAVWRAHHEKVLAYAALLRVRLAPGTEHSFTAAFHRIARGHNATLDTGGLDTGGVDDSLGVLAVGLTLFSVLGALGAIATLIVLLTRWAGAARTDQPIELALGHGHSERTLAVAAPMLPAIVGGTIGALGLAVVGSRWMPIGAARGIEPDPGFAVDGTVLGIGVLALLVLGVLLTLVSSWWATRRAGWDPTRPRATERSTRILSALTRWRLPVPAVIGSRMALDRGRGTRAVPGRSAMVAGILGITGIVAALVVGAGMHQLRVSPAAWSYGYDVIVEGNGGLVHGADEPACAPVRTALSDQRDIAAIANYCQASLSIDGGRSVTASALGPIRGTIRPTILRGRAPGAPDEVALGEKTLARTGRSIGERITVRGEQGSARVRIVGTTYFPAPNSHDTVTFADGALLPAATLAKLDAGSFPQIVIRWRADADVARGLAAVRRVSGAPATPPVRPPEIDRLLQVDDLPAILAGFLALLALVGIAHAVVTNASRRRRDLALLQTLGFRSRQIGATIAAHAATVAIVGLVVGIPVGIVVGRLCWRAVAHSAGFDPTATVPVLLIVATAPIVLAAVLGIAAFPAHRMRHLRPAVALRSE
jgi:FtsX-like permease family/MacB-like periplasmic core domain